MVFKRNCVNAVNPIQVQSTNDASIISKCSMANKNYIKDEYVKCFVHKEKPRTSLIHLGYYTRAVIFSISLVRFIKFLHMKKIVKIISCGSGFDTTYWRLVEDGLIDKNTIFIEIDYSNVINRKTAIIKQSPKLKSHLNIFNADESSCIKKLNSNYFLLSADLSEINTVEYLLNQIEIDFNIPTVFLSECVVTYMKTPDSNRLISWVTEKFRHSVFLNYEQIHPEDGFGEIMLRHFDKLQSTLHSVLTYPDFSRHRERYKSLGFEKTVVMSEWDFFVYFTTESERMRVLTLEQFDEFEEFHLKCAHYVVAIASNGVLSAWADEMNIIGFNNLNVSSIENFIITPTDQRLEIFGHASCCLRDGKVLIFGGFSPKGRSERIYALQNGKIEDIDASDEEDYRFDTIHGSVVSFVINNKVYVGLYGGRTSPNKVVNNGEFIILEFNGNKLIRKKALKIKGLPRYRHSIVCYPCGDDRVSVSIFGGRTNDLKESLPELLNVEIFMEEDDFSFNCSLLHQQRGSGPPARMSHSAVVGDDCMYITCGIDSKNFSVLDDIWKWSFSQKSWELMEPRNRKLIPRYGHTSHILGNILYLVGGVNTTSGWQPGLAMFDLKTRILLEFSVEHFRPEPLLLFNHTSVILGDEKDIIRILGGGGNCFSFGTFFNKFIQEIHLRQFRELT